MKNQVNGEGAMKTFYTERDIEDMRAAGVTEIVGSLEISGVLGLDC